MSPDLARQIVPLDWTDYVGKRDAFLRMPPEELYQRAKAYREAFARDRDPARLRKKLCTEEAQWRN